MEIPFDIPSCFDRLVSRTTFSCGYTLIVFARIVPIASIVTPATISIKSAAVFPPPVSMQHVSNLDFRSTAFLATLPGETNDIRYGSGKYREWAQRLYVYNGSSTAVAAAIKPIMANGELPQLPSPALNASWDVHFYGPCLKCSNMSQESKNNLGKEIDIYSGYMHQTYAYLAWYGNTSDASSLAPLKNSTNKSTGELGFEDRFRMNGSFVPMYFKPFHAGSLVLRNQTAKPMVLYVATMQYGSSAYSVPDVDSGGRLTAYLRCELRNCTYDVAISQADGVQTVATSVTREDDLPPPYTVSQVASDWLHRNWYALDRGFQYCSAQASDCLRNPSLLPRLAYQSVMEVFSAYLAGSICYDQQASPFIGVYTQVAETAISGSNELFDAYEPLFDYDIEQGVGLQSYISKMLNLSESVEFEGVIRNPSQGRRKGLLLATMLESLFQNVTVGLMASPQLQ